MDALQAFYALRVFHIYLDRKEQWEFAHKSYTECPDLNRALPREALMAARDRMDAALKVCRETPEHKAAFGW